MTTTDRIKLLLEIGEADWSGDWPNYLQYGFVESDVPALLDLVADEAFDKADSDSTEVWASTSGFNSNWRRLKQKAGLPDIHFHDIRAKSITDAKRKYGRDFAQELAGHASGEMTDAYVRGNPNVEPLF